MHYDTKISASEERLCVLLRCGRMPALSGEGGGVAAMSLLLLCVEPCLCCRSQHFCTFEQLQVWTLKQTWRCLLSNTGFSFQILTDLRSDIWKKSNESKKLYLCIFKVYLYFDHSGENQLCSPLQISTLRSQVNIHCCWSFTMGSGRRKLSKKPKQTQNSTNLSSELHWKTKFLSVNWRHFMVSQILK